LQPPLAVTANLGRSQTAPAAHSHRRRARPRVERRIVLVSLDEGPFERIGARYHDAARDDGAGYPSAVLVPP
jgi:hypothetical protein